MKNSFVTSNITKTANKDYSLKKVIYLGCLVALCIYNLVEAQQKLDKNGSAEKIVRLSGDVLQTIIPIVSLATPIIKNDSELQKQFFKSMFTAFTITHILKHGINASRPNGGNRSFPSGHTSSAFQGAGFIHKHYGILPATPAYFTAGFVGFSRVFTKKHHTIDVLAGALIGLGVNFFIS